MNFLNPETGPSINICPRTLFLYLSPREKQRSLLLIGEHPFNLQIWKQAWDSSRCWSKPSYAWYPFRARSTAAMGTKLAMASWPLRSPWQHPQCLSRVGLPWLRKIANWGERVFKFLKCTPTENIYCNRVEASISLLLRQHIDMGKIWEGGNQAFHNFVKLPRHPKKSRWLKQGKSWKSNRSV